MSDKYHDIDDFTGDAVAQQRPSLEEVLQSLSAGKSDTLPTVLYYGLSGLTAEEVLKIAPVWSKLDTEYLKSLLDQLTEANESNFELNYHEIGQLGLSDVDGKVRAAAIELLWEDESLNFMSRLIDMAQWDESPEVRATAVSELGRFVLLGEYEEIPETDASRAQDAAMSIWTNADEEISVRRRALEAIANSNHEIVPDAIQEAYDSHERLMQISAVFAMGRSCDQRWKEIVLREMGNNDPEMRYEAAQSAGELQIAEAVMGLGRLAVEDEREIREIAIWSLGEIGGREALRILSGLTEDAETADDEDLLEAVEDAIANATMIGEFLDFDDPE